MQKVMKTNNLSVDEWKVEHIKNTTTGEIDLIESYEGKVEMENTKTHKYLGFVLSNIGDNLNNINAMKNNSIWITRKIFTRLDGLHLKKYYFESAIIFLNVMLRSSILYECETYYKLTETQIRKQERIEEGFLRKLFQTTTGCPIVQLYLESGHLPARFAIKKAKLLFLKTILEEKSDSMINRFLNLQFDKPTKGDWASSCIKDLSDLKINMTLEEIKLSTKNQFLQTIKSAIKSSAFKYLISKQRSKGQEMKYIELKMADYLMPNEAKMTINDQRNIFAMRNKFFRK